MVGKEGQGSFKGMGMELVTDLNTGRQTLRRRRAKKPVEGKAKTPAPTEQWWKGTGLLAFHGAAEGWRQNQSVILAEASGQNVEFAGAQMRGEDTEELLKRAFAIAKSSGITSLDIVGVMKAESLSLEERLGASANWLPAFVDSAINLLGEVYGLKSANTEARKMVAHQRHLPAFK